MKSILFIILSLIFINVYACETVEPSKSSYVVDVNSWDLPNESCINYKLLLQKRSSEQPKMFLAGARIEIVGNSKNVIYSSNMELREAVEDMYLADFCIGKEFLNTSNVVLWISYPESISLGEKSSYKSGGLACHEEEVIKVAELAKYSKKAK